MHTVIMGSGGLGGYFGGLLARAGGDVTFIARGANLQVLQERGLMVRSANGDFTLQAVRACADPAGMPEADFVLFCVKTYGVAEATTLLQSVVGPNTIFLTLQNGVDTPADLQHAFGRGTVLAGITRIGSTLVKPGVIEQPTRDRAIEFGHLDPDGAAAVEPVRVLLEAADIPVVVSPDIRKSLWEKLVLISAFAGLSALTGLSPNQLLARQPTRAVYTRVMEEAAAVARAADVGLAPGIAAEILAYLDAEGELGSASMAVDFQHRRRTEIEAINGAVVRHGHRLGVPTPVNETIYAALVVMDGYQREEREQT